MSYLKKFTDFFAVFAFVRVIIYLITQYMPFKSLTAETTWGKIKDFFAATEKTDYLAVAIFAALLLLSFLISMILRNHPLPVFSVSLLPLAWCFFLFDGELLGDHPMLYILSCILNTLGAFLDALLADRRDGKGRAAQSVFLCTLVSALASLVIYLRAMSLAGQPLEGAGVLDRAIASALESDVSFAPYLRIFLMLLLIAVIGVILQRLFFLDLAIFLIPTVFVLIYWSDRALPAYGAAIAALVFVGFMGRLILTLIPTPERKSEKTASTGFLEKLKKTIKKPS